MPNFLNVPSCPRNAYPAISGPVRADQGGRALIFVIVHRSKLDRGSRRIAATPPIELDQGQRPQ